jgi:hypothetical protein
MSLLTEEQIAELACIASNQSTSKDLYEEFHDWNKKQTGVQVNVDWDKYTKNSPHAALRLHFTIVKDGLELWSDCKKTILIDRPTPVIKSHPHAYIMMEYAEVAQRRTDPWMEFEYENRGQWKRLNDHPMWGHNIEYRHIGETK